MYRFIVNQLFDGSNSDDPNLKRHLTVYPENTSKDSFFNWNFKLLILYIFRSRRQERRYVERK
jgi:hypothetical protein